MLANFQFLPWSQPSRQQFSKLYGTAAREMVLARSSSKLIKLLTRSSYNTTRGIYIPVCDNVEQKGKLPSLSRSLAPADNTAPENLQFFTNALVVPEGFGKLSFAANKALRPIDRLANAGFLVVTHEFDCETLDQFEEMLSWTRAVGGVFGRSKFGEVDRELGRLKEYVGYNITYSGRRSLHFHFVFSTDHLDAAPFDADADTRRAGGEVTAALMQNVYEEYWHHTWAVMQDKLSPSFGMDSSLKSAVQWRRMPWAVRELDKGAPTLGLEAGMRVPQLVIHENIRERAPKGAKGYLVRAEFSLAHPRTVKQRRPSTASIPIQEVAPGAVELVQDMCRTWWGSDYPMPVAVGQQKGEVLIRFKNHEADQNPSTVCIGQNSRLRLCGAHSLDGDFFLPDDTTAEELVRHANLRCGLVADPKQIDTPTGVLPTMFMPVEPVRSFADLKARSESEVDPITKNVFRPLRGLLEDIDDRQTRIDKLRDVSPQIVGRMIGLRTNYVFKAPEGFSKSTSHFDHLAVEALDEALRRDGRCSHFVAFACRSEKQAREKSEEYRARTGKGAVTIVSLQTTYERICDEIGARAISRSEFRHGSLSHFLEEIGRRQPAVAKRLEEYRRCIWMIGDRSLFDGSTTVLFMTQALARRWSETWKTRIWLHPNYDPSMPDEDAKALRSGFNLSWVVWDELEIDDLVNLLAEALYDLIQRQQRKHSNWRDMPRAERLDVFGALKIGKAIPDPDMTFDTFDSLIRLNLSTLDAVPVDFDAIPFGYDNKPNGLYNGRNGNVWYVAAQQWPSSGVKWSFLTTETLTTQIVEAVFARNERQLFTFAVPDIPGIHPIKVPVELDRRAKAKEVADLAKEIVDLNPEAYVISDGVKDVDRVLTFQKAKGFNGLEDKDIYIILTNLAPAKYEELNVLGQWLGIPEILPMYYKDQLNQAVGRNRGFRQSTTRNTRCVVITTKRLYDSVISRFGMSGRVQLWRSGEREW